MLEAMAVWTSTDQLGSHFQIWKRSASISSKYGIGPPPLLPNLDEPHFDPIDKACH